MQYSQHVRPSGGALALAPAVIAARALEVVLFHQFLQQSQHLSQVEYIVSAPAVASMAVLAPMVEYITVRMQ